MPRFAHVSILTAGGLALFLLRSDARPLQQPSAPDNWPRLAPISGRVLSAADGHPIAGAIVHYRGAGDAFNSLDNAIQKRANNPTSLQGEVKTGADGAYTLPKLPPGPFTVRASAPGFFAAKDRVQEEPVGYNPGPPMPIPSSICMPRTGKPTCGNLPEMPDGVFRLQPDPLNLQTMSDAALAVFALPKNRRDTFSAVFTPDGKRLGFITRENSPAGGNSIKLRCAVWTYDIANGNLTGVDLPGSPLVLQDWHMDPPPGFCPSYSAAWAGDGLYVFIVKADPNPPHREIVAEPYLVGKSSLTSVAPTDLPAALQEKLAREAAYAAADQAAIAQNAYASGVTKDRKFTVEDQDCEGPCDCNTLLVVGPGTQKPRTVANGCPIRYALDRERDLLFYVVIPASERSQSEGHGELVEYSLATGGRRSFDLPGRFNDPENPNFLAEQLLSDGAFRMAYSMHGDCDPAASDYSQPGQPDGELGQTPNQFSVCFITVPPAPASP